MVDTGQEAPFVLRLRPEASAVAEARRSTLEVIRGWGLPEDLADDLGMAASELVTNAVIHAGTELSVTLHRRGEGVRLEVTDQAPALLPRQPVHAPADWFSDSADDDPMIGESMTGRGLLLVETLGERWGVALEETAKTVWVELGTGLPDAAPEPEPELESVPIAPLRNAITVRLLGVPVRLILSSSSNFDDVMRELLMREGIVRDLRRPASPITQVSLSMREVMLEAGRRAVAREERLTDADLQSNVENAAAAHELIDLMDQLADLCRDGTLLALAPSDEVVEYRRWCVLEVERQVMGAPPSVCPFPVIADDDPAVLEAERQAVADLAAPSADAANLLLCLGSASVELVVSADLQDAVERALAAAADVLGARTAGLCLRTDDAIELVAAAGYPEPSLTRWRRFSITQDLPVVEVMRTREPVLLRTHRERITKFPILAGEELWEKGSMAFLPVAADGVFVVGFPDERLFSDVDRAFLLALAGVMAQATSRLRAAALKQANEETESRFRALADAAPVFIWMADAEGRCIWFSRRWLEFRGRELAEEVGDGWEAGIHPDDLERVRTTYYGAVARREAYELDYRLQRADGTYRWIFDRGVPRHLPDGTFTGFVGSCVDIDDRKSAEADALQAHEQLAFLAAVGNVVASKLHPDDVLREAVELAVPRLGDVAFAYLSDGVELQRIAVDTRTAPSLASWLDVGPVPYDAETPVNAAWLTGTAQLTDFDPADLVGVVPPVRAAIDDLGFRQGLAVPFSSPRGERLGVLAFSMTGDRTYAPADVATATALAERVGVAVENALMYQWQHTLAEQLQRAVLPDALPSSTAAVLDACYRPASMGAEVGGDWYDAFELRDGRLGIAVGDVAGHGLHAASTMGRLRNALRAYALNGDRPGDVLAWLCDFHESGELFATLVYGILDPSTDELRWANAGHLPPLLRRDGAVTPLDGPVGPPIGVDRSFRYEEAVVQMAPADVLLVYTDGLVERRGEHLDEGLAGLARILAGAGPIDELAERVVDLVLEGREHDDDVCVLAVQRS